MNQTSHTSLHRVAASILGGSILICMAASAFAQNDNPTGKSGVFNGNSDIGASYDPYTANTTRTIVDLTVPGAVGTYPLQWTRTMNSRRTEGPSYAFGSGGSWQGSYNWGIDIEREFSRINPSPQPKAYIVYYPDGRRVDFRRRTSSPVDPLFRGPAGVTDRFQPVAQTGSCFLLLSDGGKVEFYQTGTFDSEVGWDFELSGPLSITDPYGQKTTLGDTGPNGEYRITEPAGRWLQINYVNPFGTFVIGSVQAGYGTNTVTQSVTYSYQQVTAGPYMYTTLTRANYSDGTSAAYTYQTANTYPNTGPPLIQTCDDVRYFGAMKKIAYEFVTESSEPIGIYGLFANARKWLWPAPFVVSYGLATHTEQRGDGPLRSFSYGPVAGQAVCVPQPYLLSGYTDFKGNATHLCYDAIHI